MKIVLNLENGNTIILREIENSDFINEFEIPLFSLPYEIQISTFESIYEEAGHDRENYKVSFLLNLFSKENPIIYKYLKKYIENPYCLDYLDNKNKLKTG